MRLLIALAVATCLAHTAGCSDRARDTAREQRAAARRLVDEHRRDQRAEMKRLDELVRNHPDDPARYVERGFAWIEREDFSNAESQFNHALRLDRNHPGAHCGKAAVALHRENDLMALRLLDELMVRSPEYAPAYYWRGRARQWQEDYDRAIEAYDEAIKLNPTYAEAYQARGSVAFLKGSESALADFRQAIFFDPRLTDAYTGCGDVLMNQDEHSRAVRSYARAIALEPADPYAYSRRGRVLAALEKYHDAVADYTLAEELAERTDRWEVIQAMHFDRGVALYYVGDYYEASLALSSAIDEDPSNADAWFYHAECLTEPWDNQWDAENDYSEAIGLYEQAKLDDDSDYDKRMHARALYGRANARDDIGRSGSARRDRREAKRVDPDYEDD